MHPAVSVIFFTVTSGAGFGLLAMIGLGMDVGSDFVSIFIASAIGVGLSVAGLLSSTFHLGHPERAWRAFSQWRSSWLSREGVCAVIGLTLYGIYALWWMYSGERLVWLGVIVAIMSILTVFTTSMIYAQLKTVPMWNTALTPLAYLGFAAACGFLLAMGLGASSTAFLGEHRIGDAGLISAIIVIISWVIKLIWWQRASASSLSSTGSTTETATGLGHIGKVRLLEKPHSGGNYLTKEMVHVIGRKHASRLRIISLIVGAFIPLAIAISVYASILPQTALLGAAIFMICGLFAERWLFFAEAEHAVSLYY